MRTVVETKRLLDGILKAIYWRSFSSKQAEEIISIINDKDLDEHTMANDICEFLDIEKRDNRPEICKVLNQ